MMKNARRSGLSFVVLLMEFSIQDASDFLRLAAERIEISKAQSYPLPHTRVKPGFWRLKSAMAAAAGEEKCGVGFGVRLERIGISKAPLPKTKKPPA